MLALWHNQERFVKFDFGLFSDLTNCSRLLYDFAAICGPERLLSLKRTVADPKIVRRLNKTAILEAVRGNQNGISRAEVARLTTLSRATVSAIVDELLSSGVVLEAGIGASHAGRPPTLLQLNPDAGRVVGIDIGASHVLVVIADLNGKPLAECETGFDITAGPEAGLENIYRAVEATLHQTRCGMADVTGIGVGVPGPVNVSLGIVSSPPIMPGWDGFPIRQQIEARWGRPTTLDNDANLGALGEWAFGGGQGESNLVYIKIGTGIGCGVLLDGKIYNGVLGTAGEIGHVTISEDGPPCKCGNYGCLEAMAGGEAIAQRAQLAIKAGQRTLLAEINHARPITARDVATAAKAGDVVSQQLLNDAGRHIGCALASMINLLNPGLVLVGGGVTGAGDFLLDPIREAVTQRSLRSSLTAAHIELAALGRRSTALGAVSVALSKTFQQYIAAGGGLT
jgi:glucokinase-like ROK family protein